MGKNLKRDIWCFELLCLLNRLTIHCLINLLLLVVLRTVQLLSRIKKKLVKKKKISIMITLNKQNI